MNWLVHTVVSSIGKKLIMALTGLCFCGFLAVHLIGNLTLYGGRDLFLSYVEHLHSWGYLVTAAEWGLVIFGVIHVATGLILFYENWKSRPLGYVVNKWAGGRTIGSATAPYTGVLILVFIVIHLLTFRFVDKTNLNDFVILNNTFAGVGYVLLYIAAVIVVSVHVSHGFWSGFQTLGLNHPKYMPFIKKVGLVFSIVLGVGFASIPLFVLSGM